MPIHINNIKSIFPQIDFVGLPINNYTDIIVTILDWLKAEDEKSNWKEIIPQIIELKCLSESAQDEEEGVDSLHSVFLVVLFEGMFAHDNLRKIIPFLAPKSYLQENKEHILEGVSKNDFKAALKVYPKN